MKDSDRTELIELAKLLAQVKNRLDVVITRAAIRTAGLRLDETEKEKARLLTA